MTNRLHPRDAERIRGLLDDSLHDFDAATLSRLNRARQRALDQSAPAARWSWRRPALGLVLASALMLLLVPRQSVPPPVAPPVAESPAQVSLDSLEMALLAEPDDLDLVEQLEFYAWLEQEQDWDGSS
jgi:hypothetical protein